MSSEPTIWALKIQPGAAESDTNPYEFCKNHVPAIIGIGWGLNEGYQGVEEALEEHRNQENHRDQWGNVKFPIRAMLKKASVGDLVWVNEQSEYAPSCLVSSIVPASEGLEPGFGSLWFDVTKAVRKRRRSAF